MLARTYSMTHVGAKPCSITIETDMSAGLPGISIVGLASKSIDEARERIRSAFRNSSLEFPPRKLVINLAPADIAKHGTGLDLAMALGILQASGQIPKIPKNWCSVAELALDGSLRPARDAHATLLSAAEQGYKTILIDELTPLNQLLTQGLTVFRVKNLRDIYLHLIKEQALQPYRASDDESSLAPSPLNHYTDLEDIKGLESAKRALEIAAAGHHNLLLSGEPGIGKTLLAQAAIGIMPALSRAELKETSYLQSLNSNTEIAAFTQQRPFRSPHHTTSDVAIIGGGQFPKPGEISLAHNGILFMDEFPEFSRSVLEALRQPLEDKQVSVSRAQGTMVFPAKIMLIAAMNPCPCGYAFSKGHNCLCSPGIVQRYQARISRPLLDRFDLICEIRKPVYDDFFTTNTHSCESSDIIQKRVSSARQRQHDRQGEPNAFTSSRKLMDARSMEDDARQLLQRALKAQHINPRGANRIIRVSRTIADLEDKDVISLSHVAEAMQFKESRQIT
ncbi:YifB family Mg chelatase-like AAA ATPase [Candidatus Saccharibacteria bacterium]|nr:YifB family Mg chelatase-like AAA ATPase [Candidatus Saccharibacteria bacterium]